MGLSSIPGGGRFAEALDSLRRRLQRLVCTRMQFLLLMCGLARGVRVASAAAACSLRNHARPVASLCCSQYREQGVIMYRGFSVQDMAHQVGRRKSWWEARLGLARSPQCVWRWAPMRG